MEVVFMSGQQKVKKVKPKIEDVILDLVNEEHQKTALDFVGYIRSSKMTPAWASTNSWKVSYKGECLCYIRTAGTAHYHNLDEGSWHVHFAAYSDQVYEIPISNEAVKMIWDNVKHCTKCSNCKPPNHLTINGKEFNKVCHQWLTIKNPDFEALECLKKLIETIRCVIYNNIMNIMDERVSSK